MKILGWLQRLFTQRGKALAWYRSGMVKAKLGDYRGAIADYSAAIQAPDIPTDVKAMAIYNRALAYSALEEHSKAAADLATMLTIPGVPEDVKTAAHQRRVRIQMREQRQPGEEKKNRN